MKKWPDDGEIDIMEQVGAEPNLIYATLHTKAYSITRSGRSGARRSSCRPAAARSTLSARLAARIRSPSASTGAASCAFADDQPDGKAAWPFDAPFDLILNLAIGGDWAARRASTMRPCRSGWRLITCAVWQVPIGKRS